MSQPYQASSIGFTAKVTGVGFGESLYNGPGPSKAYHAQASGHYEPGAMDQFQVRDVDGQKVLFVRDAREDGVCCYSECKQLHQGE